MNCGPELRTGNARCDGDDGNYADFFLIGAALIIVPFWMIWKKAGFSPWMSLLMFVPLVGIVMLYVLAFSQWKVVPVQAAYPPQYPPSTFPPQV